MSIFTYTPDELLGTVESVDTSMVIVKVENDDKLRGLQVNHLISIQSSRVGQHLIGLVSKIIRKSEYSDPSADIIPELGFNIIKVILIGTHFDRDGAKENVFRQSHLFQRAKMLSVCKSATILLMRMLLLGLMAINCFNDMLLLLVVRVQVNHGASQRF